MCSPAKWSVQHANDALQQLQQTVLERDSKLIARNAEIAAIQVRYASDLATADGRIARLEADLETFYGANQAEIERGGKKCLQLGYGLIGMRAASNPALVPMAEKWTWEKIAKKVKALFKGRFFHDPKPPGLDKVKIKREMTPAQMEKCGLKLDDSEHFYIELNQIKASDKLPKAA